MLNKIKFNEESTGTCRMKVLALLHFFKQVSFVGILDSFEAVM